MGYKDKKKQCEYQKQWCAARRLKWIKEHGPCVVCGRSITLQVDHIDRKQKVSHSVWSWSAERRDAELAKCQVLCRTCHDAKTDLDGSRVPRTHGTMSRYRKGCRCLLCASAFKRYKEYRAIWVWLKRRGIDPRPLVPVLRTWREYQPGSTTGSFSYRNN